MSPGYVSSWYQVATLPDRWDVAGVKCRPVTVWHRYMLASIANPYLFQGRIARDRNDAASLLTVVSRDHAQGKRLYVAPFYRGRVRRKINRTLKRHKWEHLDAACMEYIETCLRRPAHKEIKHNPKQGPAPNRKANAPEAWVLVEYLSGGDPAKVEAAWNTPYVVAKCLFDANRDIAGEDRSLESVEEEERYTLMLEKAKAEQAEQAEKDVA